MKNSKTAMFILILSLAVIGGLIIADRAIKMETKPSPQPLSIVVNKAQLDERKKWEASPDGIRYKQWQVSPAGRKVHASHEKIRKQINAFTNMEAVVTSVSYRQPNAKSGPKWLVVSINGEAYMMQFIPEEFEPLHNLKVNDKIIVRSRSAGYSPNHPYLIISGDYIARNNKVLFKRDFSKNNGC